MKLLTILLITFLSLSTAYAGSGDDKHGELLKRFGNNAAAPLGDGKVKVGFILPYHLLIIDTKNEYFFRGTRAQRKEWLFQYCPHLYSNAWDHPDFPNNFYVMNLSDTVEVDGDLQLKETALVMICRNPR